MIKIGNSVLTDMPVARIRSLAMDIAQLREGGIEVLVIVVEPGSRSIETANHIAKMAQEMGITQIAAIVNKITDPSQVDIIRKQLDNIPLLGGLPHSLSLPQADLNGVPMFEADAEIVRELTKAKEKLFKLIDNELIIKG